MENYRQQWQAQGYLVLRGALAPERVARLYEIGERAYAQWRLESSPGSEPGSLHYQPAAWCMLHLNHPKYHVKRTDGLACLLDTIADPLSISIVEDILQEPAGFMQANYYIDPPGESFNGGWHRDCQFSAPDEAREKIDFQAEADPPRELHLHIPLVSTAATEVVPGSHRRWDTTEENRVRRHDPHEGTMPGALRLQLEPGDLALFHVNALHRGHYSVGVPRRTIAITYGRTSARRPITAELMRDWAGYRGTYQPWFLNPDYLEGVNENTRTFFKQFVEQYGPHWKPEYLVPELGEKRIAYFRDFVAWPTARP